MATMWFSGEWSHTAFLLANAPYLPSSMARMKVTPKQGKQDEVMQVLQMRAATKVEGREKKPLSLVHPPTPAKEAPL